MVNYVLILALLGLVGTAYTLYAENRRKRDESFRGLCDITDTFSCTRAANSRWESVILGIPNGLLAASYYVLVVFLGYLGYPALIFYASIGVAAFGLFIFSMLVTREKVWCTGCTMNIVIPASIAYLTYAFI